LLRRDLFDDPENANGKLLLESKKEMRARGIPSPDEDDAIALCFSEPDGAGFGRQ
jgi:hypothetical protein